jgi:hypothetical protein
MHPIAGWPILSVLSLATLSVATMTNSRNRFILSWVVLPVLLEGVILHFFYMNLR